MDRAALLSAAAKAASAAAAGVDDIDEQRALDGNRFEFRIRFGCNGPAAKDSQAVMSWSFESKDRTLRVQAAPDLSKDDPLIGGIAGDAFEAAEGFWVPRPWMLQATCPAKPEAMPAEPPTTPAPPAATPGKVPAEPDLVNIEPPPLAEHRVAIAQFFSPTDSRTLRRDGRPYKATTILDDTQQPSDEGYDLVLSGRLKRLPDRRVIECRAGQPNRAPRCVISASFDRVWIERPGSGEVIAEWGGGG
jgi:hypothetical protein